jgi:phosphohistidine phosphatase
MKQMRLYLMRHADAGRSEWSGDDFERPITDKGRSRTRAMAEHLRSIGVAPNRVITSPLTRAAQTATIAAGVLGAADTLAQDARLAAGFDIGRLAAILKDNADVESLMVVGHEPSMSSVVGDLIGGGDVVMKKGAVACVDLVQEGGTGSGTPAGALLWLLSPGSLGL